MFVFYNLSMAVKIKKIFSVYKIILIHTIKKSYYLIGLMI